MPKTVGRAHEAAEDDEAEEIPGCLAAREAPVRDEREQPERGDEVGEMVGGLIDDKYSRLDESMVIPASWAVDIRP